MVVLSYQEFKWDLLKSLCVTACSSDAKVQSQEHIVARKEENSSVAIIHMHEHD